MSDRGAPPPPPPHDPWRPFEAPDDPRFQPPRRWQQGHPIDIRPFTLSDIYERAFNLYRLHWKTLIAFVAILLVPLDFLEEYLVRNLTRYGYGFGQFQAHVSRADANRAAVIGLVLSAISFFFVQPLLSGGLARAAAAFHLGRSPKVGDIVDGTLPFLLSIVWVIFLTALVVIGGFILLIIPGFIFLVRFAFGVPSLVLEHEHGTEAMRRSWRLTAGNFWRVLGIVLLTWLLAAFVSGVVVIPTAIAAHGIGPSGWWLRALGASIAGVLTMPFVQLVTVLLYLDLRARKEGLTPEQLGSEMDDRG